MIERLLFNIIRKINPPDIKKVYKLKRDAQNFVISSAVKMNSGHYDKVIRVKDGYNIPVSIYPPGLKGKRNRLIIFFHGGGWVIEETDRYHKICRQLADVTEGYVISVHYRLAPENKFPAGFNDCYRAAACIFRQAVKLGYSERNIILAGDSAGGNLAAAVSLKALKRADFRVYRQILLYPVTACEYDRSSPYKSVHENGKGCILTSERMQGYLELYLNDISEKNNPYVAPIKAADLSSMPQTLIITAEYDPLRDEGEAFGKRIYKEGGKVMAFRIKDAYHGFFATDLAKHPHARRAVSMIMYFLGLTD